MKVAHVRNKFLRSKNINCFLEAKLSDRTLLSLIRLKSYFNNMLIVSSFVFLGKLTSHEIINDHCTENCNKRVTCSRSKKLFP